MNDHVDVETHFEHLMQRIGKQIPQAARGLQPEREHTLVVIFALPLEAEQMPVLAPDRDLLVCGLDVQFYQQAAGP